MAEGDVPAKKIKRDLLLPKLPDDEVNSLRESLQALDDNVLFSFKLLKIIKSNAEMCAPFKKCFLKIERSSDKNQPVAERKIVYNFAGVFEKGVNMLNLYLEDPEKVPEDKELRVALLRLANTILKIEDVGAKLAKKTNSPDRKRETDWCVSLAHHLLKELSVNQHYRLDMFSKFKKYSCSCCNEPIGDYGEYDDCSLGTVQGTKRNKGNSKVWHGNVDILLGPHPDVAVCTKDDEPTDEEGSLSSFEVKDSSDLIKDRSQIISEAIVFAFLQKKYHPGFDNYLIPTVGISKCDVLFYMYDPEHDILLESTRFNIFEEPDSNELSYITVLALWLILNYKTFCTGITEAMKERNFTADFLSQVNSETKTIYKDHLQFKGCGTGFIKADYGDPKLGKGWRLKKSKPFKKP